MNIAGFAGDHLTRVLVGMPVEPDIPLRKFSKDLEMMGGAHSDGRTHTGLCIAMFSLV